MSNEKRAETIPERLMSLVSLVSEALCFSALPETGLFNPYLAFAFSSWVSSHSVLVRILTPHVHEPHRKSSVFVYRKSFCICNSVFCFKDDYQNCVSLMLHKPRLTFDLINTT